METASTPSELAGSSTFRPGAWGRWGSLGRSRSSLVQLGQGSPQDAPHLMPTWHTGRKRCSTSARALVISS